MSDKMPIYAFTADDLPQRDTGTSLVTFGGVTPKQRAEAPDVDALAAKHEKIARDHLAAAQWLRTEYEPAVRPVYKDVVEAVSLSFPVRVPVEEQAYMTDEDWTCARSQMYRTHSTLQDFRYCGTTRNGDPVEVNGVWRQPYVHLFQATKTTRVLVEPEAADG